MKDLKKINTTDPEEKAALNFLTKDKFRWKTNINEKEYKIISFQEKFENPVNKKFKEMLEFCLETDFDYPAETVEKCLNDLEIRKEYDSMYKELKEISKEVINENVSSIKLYLFLKLPFFLSDRDFVISKKVWKNYNGVQNSMLSHISSIDHKDYPEKEKPVRGLFYNRACYIEPISEKKCHMILCNCFDMGFPNLGEKAEEKGVDDIKNFYLNLKKHISKL